jgi:hypothetical protein
VHAKDVRHIAPCAILGAGYAQNAAEDGGLSLIHQVTKKNCETRARSSLAWKAALAM